MPTVVDEMHNFEKVSDKNYSVLGTPYTFGNTAYVSISLRSCLFSHLVIFMKKPLESIMHYPPRHSYFAVNPAIPMFTLKNGSVDGVPFGQPPNNSTFAKVMYKLTINIL